jgi:hypothetical protein
MLIPVDRPREIKKSEEVNTLVFTSNLCSKNSYAVKTFNLLNKGTKLIQIITIAIGNPK